MPAREAITVLSVIYVALLVVQGTTVVLYQLALIPHGVALAAGLATSLAGPLLSLLVSLRVFRHRQLSRTFDIASVALTYACTCISFAVLYLILAGQDSHAFTLASPQPRFGLTTALYFSLVTITTTGYGDVSPLSGLARFIACWEIVTGLLYQVFVFSLAAALVTAPPNRPPATGGDPDDTTAESAPASKH